MGAAGRYGFYEALDFTRARLPDDAGFAIVRCFMAHHQGMTIVRSRTPCTKAACASASTANR